MAEDKLDYYQMVAELGSNNEELGIKKNFPLGKRIQFLRLEVCGIMKRFHSAMDIKNDKTENRKGVEAQSVELERLRKGILMKGRRREKMERIHNELNNS